MQHLIADVCHGYRLFVRAVNGINIVDVQSFDVCVRVLTGGQIAVIIGYETGMKCHGNGLQSAISGILYGIAKELQRASFGTQATQAAFAADPIIERMTRQQLEKSIAETTRLMKDAAKRLDFLQAAQYRDEIIRLQKELELK